jgi:hypothetical protein
VAGLRDAGFAGFVPLMDIGSSALPAGRGVFLVIRESTEEPVFLDSSPAGIWQGRDPSVPPSALKSRWIPEARVLYIAKSGGSSIASRLRLLVRFGEGEAVPHYGGRLVWQIAGAGELLVAWKQTIDTDPDTMKHELISDFEAHFGTTPFANLRRELSRGSQRKGSPA